MSIFDVLIFAIYCLCGFAAARYLALRFGLIYGIIGFIVGFCLAMILCRYLMRTVLRGRKK